MATLTIHPLPRAGLGVRLLAWCRGWVSRRHLWRLAGYDVVVLAGRAYPVRAVPLGVARDLVPALVRCSQAFVALDIAEPLYDDLVKALALGLGVPVRDIEAIPASLWELAIALDIIARANGLQPAEAGQTALGKPRPPSTGTTSTPGSSTQQAGHGSTSTHA